MSKPKPGLGKGLARTLAAHSASSAPSAVIHHPVALASIPLWDAPELGRRSYSSSSSPLRASVEALFSLPQYLPPSLLFDRPRQTFNDFVNPTTNPPPPPPAAAAIVRVPSPPHPAKQAKPAEVHSVLAPAQQLNNGTASATNPHLTYLGSRSNGIDIQPSTSLPDPNNLNLYSSSLIFHLGSSGAPKERTHIPPSRKRAVEPPPPRQRSFPLPDVTPPTTLQSVAVGEDSYFARVDGVCVADGVGGWSRSGTGPGDPGRWARLLTHFCEEEVERWWAGADDYMTTDDDVSGWAARAWKRGSEEKQKHRRPLDPVEIMQKGYEKCLACAAQEGIYGSSTCLLALLHHSTLLVANLGDCSLLIIRRGEVVFRTAEMQHAFNFPLQLGTHSRDEPMKDAKRYDIGVEKEDVVIVGSDGLMDNLFDEDILETLSEFAPPNQSGSLPPFSPQLVSEALLDRARAVSEQMTATTPFMMRAIEEGIDFVGGKKDDISVVVGVIGDRDGTTLTLDTKSHH
ncbi:uncharacterized protein CcaverHIS019_0603650 [Cutaneotrichosporon cavernicola]|uniref:Protein phosphatase n=1 Tax=Cutaneotrichosporon cavernicola TaxID=279322 RepID=A0AA48L869_9TREE|nr:uncharacterized protein CcaverHIS019_0603650 [Cutaneotrichosporon cavernicola]BEI93906.1 hypothetical protein CcaverHIS019_0603650 [Cutaneotrichosporon cavernicola]BEJ01684.1 hypothetical protein CcaverHIS631_0603660 [Cutaneotrichosporon cavernicola]BEJ09452.1 hypothetical protein CcaverHIS641_0603670 [Cutaneotrichosporon cavernicola]